MFFDYWQSLQQQCADHGAKLIAVSKYTDTASIEQVASFGQRDFAESRPQQLRDRALAYPNLRWHMIGHLQKNKAKYIGQYAAMWHSLVDLETAIAVNKSVPLGQILPVLIQVDISGEAQKQGVDGSDVAALYAALQRECPALIVVGLMGMAADADVESVRASFRTLRQLRNHWIDQGLFQPVCHELSMGMSGDYQIAMEEGATMVRIGSILFRDA
ncbi:MAG: YggS family pyridoxal phosphate-dependent enzyme [Zetaproteobacteria bacterium]|nr:YggS family pyridoxal phosphate-dependent enzyme [Zetaproteobacteria bacterium]